MQWWTRFFLCSAASEAVAIQEHTIAGGASSITYDASGVSEAMGRAVAADHSTELLSSTTGLMLVPARKLDASSPLHATQRAVHAGLSVTGISANSTEWFGSKHGSEVMEILGSASGNALTPAASITAGLQLTAPSQLVKDVQDLRYLGQGNNLACWQKFDCATVTCSARHGSEHLADIAGRQDLLLVQHGHRQGRHASASIPTIPDVKLAVCWCTQGLNGHNTLIRAARRMPSSLDAEAAWH